MSSYVRSIKAPIGAMPYILNDVKVSNKYVTLSTLGGKEYGEINFLSSTPIVSKIDKPVNIQRNSSVDVLKAKLNEVVFYSDAGLVGTKFVLDVSGVTLKTSGAYTVVATVTDREEAEATVSFTINIVDSIKPIITAVDTVVAYSDIVAWEPTVSATDNDLDDITSSIVTTYFEDDKVTSIASLAAFRTHLDNSGAGLAAGKVVFNVTDAAGNKAAEVTIRVTSEEPIG